MTFEDWSQLSAEEQGEQCQSLNPYEEWSLFKSVESAFVEQHGQQSGIVSVFCGFASGLGSLNAITVSIKRGTTKTRIQLPEFYMGFPVLRDYVRDDSAS